MYDLTPLILITILLLIVAAGIIVFVLIYQKKQLQYISEKKQLKANYEKEILESQLEMQEQTFNTISQEIHDNVGQTLSLAKVQLNIIDQSESLNKMLLADAKDSVSKAMTDLRDIAKSLSTKRIHFSSLIEITAHELQRLNRAGLLLTALKTDGEEHHLPEQKKLVIFRIIQEALQNILKHSKAKKVEIFFFYKADQLTIKIEDDGMGFNKDLLATKDGLGLQNIVNRAALIGGKAEIRSIINEGTSITISSPYA